MEDNKTPHLGLPLPDLANQQDEDVPRIAEALAGLDAHAAQGDARIADAEEGLGGAVERVVVLEDDALELRKDMGALSGRVDAVEAKSPDLASKDRAGIVKIGEGIAVTDDGTISVTPIDLASPQKAGTVKPGMGMTVANDGALNISYWDAFPPFVPIPVWGVKFGGSDGRRAIMPGETSAREDWILCDGGTDGKGGAVPNLVGRTLLGASASYVAGTTGGSANHNHTVSGGVQASTLTTDQLAYHAHYYTGVYERYTGDSGGSLEYLATGATTGAAGSNWGHNHSFSTTSATVSNIMPYYALNFVMRVI